MIYEHYCPVCKRKTLNLVLKVNSLRGYRLLCLGCFRETRYIKLKDLKGMKRNVHTNLNDIPSEQKEDSK